MHTIISRPIFLSLFLATLLSLMVACGEDDPAETPSPSASEPEMEPGQEPEPGMDPEMDTDPLQNCEAPDTDYSPGADDSWMACISDDNTYHQIEMTISTIGRVGGFEEIADILWRDSASPDSEAFVDARVVYSADEGLDSRIVRREDEHFPPVSDGMGGTLQCRDEGVPAMDPDRCVGPAKILPVIVDAFQKGINQEDPHLQSARIEAALLWFFYVSSHKEATTCTGKAKDCDSAYAYYTGGTKREEDGFGLAGYVQDAAPSVHDDVWDGILAVRCWRDLDNGEEATDLALRDRAITQLDTALLRGITEVVLDRADAFSNASGDEQAAHWAFLQILGPVLTRAVTEIDADAGNALAAEWEKTDAGDVDTDMIFSALDGVYCSY